MTGYQRIRPTGQCQFRKRARCSATRPAAPTRVARGAPPLPEFIVNLDLGLFLSNWIMCRVADSSTCGICVVRRGRKRVGDGYGLAAMRHESLCLRRRVRPSRTLGAAAQTRRPTIVQPSRRSLGRHQMSRPRSDRYPMSTQSPRTLRRQRRRSGCFGVKCLVECPSMAMAQACSTRFESQRRWPQFAMRRPPLCAVR